ncbi:SMP-30/gluconolactonase/LRE family protein [Chloroflexota bacterium]
MIARDNSHSIAKQNKPVIVGKTWLKVTNYAGGIEGPAFDRQGNLYFVLVGGDKEGWKVFKVSPDKMITKIYRDKVSHFTSIKIHKDGRLFLCDANSGATKSGRVIAMNPDGTSITDIVTNYHSTPVRPNDMVFDSKGNLYWTDFQGNVLNPTGRVFRISSDLTNNELLAGGFAGPNGITLSPDERLLWVADMFTNRLIALEFEPGTVGRTIIRSFAAYHFTGLKGPDSNTVDAEGNIYQAIYGQGKVVVLNKEGIPVQELMTPERKTLNQLDTTNVAIKPGSDEGVITVGGTDGNYIVKFKALALGLRSFSHQ